MLIVLMFFIFATHIGSASKALHLIVRARLFESGALEKVQIPDLNSIVSLISIIAVKFIGGYVQLSGAFYRDIHNKQYGRE
jgi:hypothetical protein